jgi:hypothetical protein
MSPEQVGEKKYNEKSDICQFSSWAHRFSLQSHVMMLIV